MFQSRRFLLAVIGIALAPSALALVPISSQARIATMRGPAAKVEALAGGSATDRARSQTTSKPAAPVKKWRKKKPHAFRWPAKGWITQWYGGRTDFHHGIDIACAYNTPIIASHSGRVIWRGRNPWYGKAVVIGKSTGWNHLYGHLRNFWVKPGEYVKQGEVIGTCGSTGNSTGYHLHFEIRKGSRYYNPAKLLP